MTVLKYVVQNKYIPEKLERGSVKLATISIGCSAYYNVNICTYFAENVLKILCTPLTVRREIKCVNCVWKV